MSRARVIAWELQQGRKEKGRVAKVRFAVQIRESSLHAASRFPQVQKALSGATNEFLKTLGEFPEKEAVFKDYFELVSLLGDPWGDV